MKKLNLYYLAILAIALLLWKLNGTMNKEVVAFYGFAENKETEINFNYPVVVGAIKVRPGEFVTEGTPLIDLYRMKAKETLEEEPYKIAELRAKESIWRTEKDNELQELANKKILAVEKINTDIQKLKEQTSFNESLYKDLKSIPKGQKKYSPAAAKIKALERERSLINANYETQVKAIHKELRVGKNPYSIAINRLKAEQRFSEASKKQFSQIMAPTDGVIGNIHCKEAEHIPSYKTLVTFYEPNPTLVKGFVQEDLLLYVTVKDSFIIRSTKDPLTFCVGEVIGLGSRIVEIPERLRKIPDMKTYGREVLVAIPAKNPFLQKEKVILEFVNPPPSIKMETRTAKPLVELKKGRIDG